MPKRERGPFLNLHSYPRFNEMFEYICQRTDQKMRTVVVMMALKRWYDELKREEARDARQSREG